MACSLVYYRLRPFYDSWLVGIYPGATASKIGVVGLYGVLRGDQEIRGGKAVFEKRGRRLFMSKGCRLSKELMEYFAVRMDGDEVVPVERTKENDQTDSEQRGV